MVTYIKLRSCINIGFTGMCPQYGHEKFNKKSKDSPKTARRQPGDSQETAMRQPGDSPDTDKRQPKDSSQHEFRFKIILIFFCYVF